MAEGSSTVVKSLDLLDIFSERRPYAGLSEIAKLSGNNKASTLRLLNALQLKGFVEQDSVTKTYTLGTAFLRFAQLRESILPMDEAVQQMLRELAAATKETAHASILTGDSLANIGTVESKRANRVSIEPGEVLPFHATSSGLVVLAFSDPNTISATLDRDLQRHASETMIDPDRIGAELQTIRRRGYASTTATYEDGVTGIAAPCFDAHGKVCGAIAVAIPTIRATEDARRLAVTEVRTAALRLTGLRGGLHPQDFPHHSPEHHEEEELK